MAVQRAEYEVVGNFVQMCGALIVENQDRCGHIDPWQLRMAMIVDREPPAEGPLFKLVRANNPVSLFCPFRYVIVTWHRTWDQIGGDGQPLLIADAPDCLCAET